LIQPDSGLHVARNDLFNEKPNPEVFLHYPDFHPSGMDEILHRFRTVTNLTNQARFVIAGWASIPQAVAMNMFKLCFFSVLLGFCGCSSISSKFSRQPKMFSLPEVTELCESEGIRVLVHGADHKRGYYVASWSNPQSFFNRYNFSFVSQKPEIRDQISELKRGDALFVKGPVRVHKGQPHILIEAFELRKPFEPGVVFDGGAYAPKTELPGELAAGGRESGRQEFYVHATDQGGKIIVLEFGDTIVPMYVKSAEHTSGLHRGDYVDVAYTISSSDNPHRPVHLILNETAEEPVRVLDEIVTQHQQDLDVTGRLVMFPKSPTINNNVFAVEVRHKRFPDLPARYFTIVPEDFESDSFQAFRDLFHAAWDQDSRIFKGRNKYIHLNLNVNVKGTGNVVSQNQANAQIFTDLEKIQIIK